MYDVPGFIIILWTIYFVSFMYYHHPAKRLNMKKKILNAEKVVQTNKHFDLKVYNLYIIFSVLRQSCIVSTWTIFYKVWFKVQGGLQKRVQKKENNLLIVKTWRWRLKDMGGLTFIKMHLQLLITRGHYNSLMKNVNACKRHCNWTKLDFRNFILVKQCLKIHLM